MYDVRLPKQYGLGQTEFFFWLGPNSFQVPKITRPTEIFELPDIIELLKIRKPLTIPHPT